jgi:hypothetical protein
MKQVPNPLPKVLSRRGVGGGLEAAERESFERTQVRTWGGKTSGHLWGARRDAVSGRGFEGSWGLAGPGEDGIWGSMSRGIWERRPGRLGTPGIPAGQETGAGPDRQTQGSQGGGGRGRHRKGDAPKLGRAFGGALGFSSVGFLAWTR